MAGAAHGDEADARRLGLFQGDIEGALGGDMALTVAAVDHGE